MTAFDYTDQARELQKRFDTEALAAAELQVIVGGLITMDAWGAMVAQGDPLA